MINEVYFIEQISEVRWFTTYAVFRAVGHCNQGDK